jgi:4-hydroxyacetophenone monooxygenase
MLRRALEAANLPTLLMVLYHLTGEDEWLADPYRPTRTPGLSEHDSGGFSEDVQSDIRAAAFEAMIDWSDGKPVAVEAPTPELLQVMMTTCVGEPIPAEYGEMMAVEMGFSPREPAQIAPSAPLEKTTDLPVVIIGAGVSGLAAAAMLRERGIPFAVVEKNDHVGGAWLENRYPGAGSDTPSYLYSYSFFPHNWSTYFGKRNEMWRYLHDMAHHFDLIPAIRFNQEVVRADYDDNGQRWSVTVRDERGAHHQLQARAVITAVGLLNRPKIPSLPGIDDFRGPIFHSAHWPEHLQVAGKRVAVVGNGASAMQIVPTIANEVAELTVFQRSPQWLAPVERYMQEVDQKVHWLMSNVPFYHHWYRFRAAWMFNDKHYPTLQIDPDWPYPDRAVNAINDGHRRYFTRYLQERLQGREDLQRKSIPTYPPFGKRILLDPGWYDALLRPNVELVTEAVAEITETGVRTTSGQAYEADIVVLCTGFHAQRQLYPMDIRGRSGRPIRELWNDDDATAYLGMTMPGFPNLFFTYGPNTNPNGGSYIFIAECQVRYIVDLITEMINRGIGATECRRDVHDDYNCDVDETHARMIWSHSGMDTYFRNARGRVVTNMPWRVVDYWHMTRRPDLDDFVTEVLHSAR